MPKQKKGLHIVFEGLDGGGKSTQAKLLTERLRSQGYIVHNWRERPLRIVKQISKITSDPKNTNMAMTTETLIYAARMAQIIAEDIIPHLKKGHIVISVRYTPSLEAIFHFIRGVERKISKEINRFIAHGVKSDIMILCDAEPKKAYQKVLAIELRKGIVRPKVGRRFGELVGVLHGKTFGKNIIIRNKKEDEDMREFNYAFRTAGAEKFAKPEVKKIVAESKEAKRALIISDLASKNTFVEGSKVRLYDFEGAHMGDPAWDVGFVLGHFMLEAAHRPKIKEKVKKLIIDFMTSYKEKMAKYGIDQKELEEIGKQATKFMGATMLHRIAGGVKKGKKVYKAYISKEKLNRIKNIAVALLRGICSKPEEAILTLTK